MQSGKYIASKIKLSSTMAERMRSCTCTPVQSECHSYDPAVDEAIIKGLLPEYDVERVILVTEYVNGGFCSSCLPCCRSTCVNQISRLSELTGCSNSTNGGANCQLSNECQCKVARSVDLCGSCPNCHAPPLVLPPVNLPVKETEPVKIADAQSNQIDQDKMLCKAYVMIDSSTSMSGERLIPVLVGGRPDNLNWQENAVQTSDHLELCSSCAVKKDNVKCDSAVQTSGSEIAMCASLGRIEDHSCQENAVQTSIYSEPCPSCAMKKDNAYCDTAIPTSAGEIFICDSHGSVEQGPLQMVRTAKGDICVCQRISAGFTGPSDITNTAIDKTEEVAPVSQIQSSFSDAPVNSSASHVIEECKITLSHEQPRISTDSGCHAPNNTQYKKKSVTIVTEEEEFRSNGVNTSTSINNEFVKQAVTDNTSSVEDLNQKVDIATSTSNTDIVEGHEIILSSNSKNQSSHEKMLSSDVLLEFLNVEENSIFCQKIISSMKSGSDSSVVLIIEDYCDHMILQTSHRFLIESSAELHNVLFGNQFKTERHNEFDPFSSSSENNAIHHIRPGNCVDERNRNHEEIFEDERFLFSSEEVQEQNLDIESRQESDSSTMISDREEDSSTDSACYALSQENLELSTHGKDSVYQIQNFSLVSHSPSLPSNYLNINFIKKNEDFNDLPVLVNPVSEVANMNENLLTSDTPLCGITTDSSQHVLVRGDKDTFLSEKFQLNCQKLKKETPISPVIICSCCNSQCTVPCLSHNRLSQSLLTELQMNTIECNRLMSTPPVFSQVSGDKVCSSHTNNDQSPINELSSVCHSFKQQFEKSLALLSRELSSASSFPSEEEERFKAIKSFLNSKKHLMSQPNKDQEGMKVLDDMVEGELNQSIPTIEISGYDPSQDHMKSENSSSVLSKFNGLSTKEEFPLNQTSLSKDNTVSVKIPAQYVLSADDSKLSSLSTNIPGDNASSKKSVPKPVIMIKKQDSEKLLISGHRVQPINISKLLTLKRLEAELPKSEPSCAIECVVNSKCDHLNYLLPDDFLRFQLTEEQKDNNFCGRRSLCDDWLDHLEASCTEIISRASFQRMKVDIMKHCFSLVTEHPVFIKSYSLQLLLSDKCGRLAENRVGTTCCNKCRANLRVSKHSSELLCPNNERALTYFSSDNLQMEVGQKLEKVPLKTLFAREYRVEIKYYFAELVSRGEFLKKHCGSKASKFKLKCSSGIQLSCQYFPIIDCCDALPVEILLEENILKQKNVKDKNSRENLALMNACSESLTWVRNSTETNIDNLSNTYLLKNLSYKNNPSAVNYGMNSFKLSDNQSTTSLSCCSLKTYAVPFSQKVTSSEENVLVKTSPLSPRLEASNYERDYAIESSFVNHEIIGNIQRKNFMPQEYPVIKKTPMNVSSFDDNFRTVSFCHLYIETLNESISQALSSLSRDVIYLNQNYYKLCSVKADDNHSRVTNQLTQKQCFSRNSSDLEDDNYGEYHRKINYSLKKYSQKKQDLNSNSHLKNQYHFSFVQGQQYSSSPVNSNKITDCSISNDCTYLQYQGNFQANNNVIKSDDSNSLACALFKPHPYSETQDILKLKYNVEQVKSIVDLSTSSNDKTKFYCHQDKKSFQQTCQDEGGSINSYQYQVSNSGSLSEIYRVPQFDFDMEVCNKSDSSFKSAITLRESYFNERFSVKKSKSQDCFDADFTFDNENLNISCSLNSANLINHNRSTEGNEINNLCYNDCHTESTVEDTNNQRELKIQRRFCERKSFTEDSDSNTYGALSNIVNESQHKFDKNCSVSLKGICKKNAVKNPSRSLPKHKLFQYFLTTHTSSSKLNKSKSLLCLNKNSNMSIESDFTSIIERRKSSNFFEKTDREEKCHIPFKKLSSSMNLVCLSLPKIAFKKPASINDDHCRPSLEGKNIEDDTSIKPKETIPSTYLFAYDKGSEDNKFLPKALTVGSLNKQSKGILKNDTLDISYHTFHYTTFGDSINNKFKKEVEELKAGLSQTNEELQRVRELLAVQYKVNNCYREEMENLSELLKSKCDSIAKSQVSSLSPDQIITNEIPCVTLQCNKRIITDTDKPCVITLSIREGSQSATTEETPQPKEAAVVVETPPRSKKTLLPVPLPRSSLQLKTDKTLEDRNGQDSPQRRSLPPKVTEDFSESEQLLLLKDISGNELETECDSFLSSSPMTNEVQGVNGNEKNLMSDFKDGIDGKDDLKAIKEPDLMRENELLSTKELSNNAIISHKLRCTNQLQFSPKKECSSGNEISVQMKDFSDHCDTSIKKNSGCIYKRLLKNDRHLKKIRLTCSNFSNLQNKSDARKSLLLSSNINQFQGIKSVGKKTPEDLLIDYSDNKEIEKNKCSVPSFQGVGRLYYSRLGSNTSHYSTKSKIPVRIKNNDISEKIFLQNVNVGSLTEKLRNNFLTNGKFKNNTQKFVSTHCFSDKLEVISEELDESAHESENFENVNQNILNKKSGQCIVQGSDDYQEKLNFIVCDELTERDSKHGKHNLIKFGSDINVEKLVFSTKFKVQRLNCNNKIRSTFYRSSKDNNTNNFNKIYYIQVSDDIPSEERSQKIDSDSNCQTIEEISCINTKSSKLLNIQNENKLPEVSVCEAKSLEKCQSSIKLSVENYIDTEELIEFDELQSSCKTVHGKNLKVMNNFDMNSKYFIGFKSNKTNDCSKEKHFLDSSGKSLRSEQSALPSYLGDSLKSTCYGEKQNQLVNSEVHLQLEKMQLPESIKIFSEDKGVNFYEKLMLGDKSKLNNHSLVNGDLLKQSIADDEHLLAEELKNNESVLLDEKLSSLNRKYDSNMNIQKVKTRTSPQNVSQQSSGHKLNCEKLTRKKIINLGHSFSSANSVLCDDLSVVVPEHLENCCYEQQSLMSETKSHKSSTQSAVFKIFINDLQLTSKSINHLRKIYSNPQIFLTWKFLDLGDNAYSSVQPAEQAVFQSSSEYHGPSTPEVLQYMAKCNVCIDCYLKLKGSSYHLARGEFNVAPAIDQPRQKFIPKILLNGEFVEGTLHCWCLMNF